MLARILNRRALATVAIAIAAAGGSVAGVSLAQGNGSPPPADTQSVAPARPAGILAGVDRILSGLVAAGTITRQQADAVGNEANAGSIDPKQLVQSGVLSQEQMQTVGDRIDQLKRGYSNP